MFSISKHVFQCSAQIWILRFCVILIVVLAILSGYFHDKYREEQQKNTKLLNQIEQLQ